MLLLEFGDDYLAKGHELALTRRKAFNWIVKEDGLKLEPTAGNLIQRFVVALLYFQTTKDHAWISCNPGGPVLCYLRDVRGIESSSPYKVWLSDVPECFWAGVGCSRGSRYITEIQLRKRPTMPSLVLEKKGEASSHFLFVCLQPSMA